MEVVIELLKPKRRKSEKISALSLIILWECLYLDLLLSNLNLKLPLKFLPYLHVNRKKDNTVSCCIPLLL